VVIRQGDVYWVGIEAPVGSETGFTRPVVVVQNNATNSSAIGTVLVCAISTNLRRAGVEGNVSLAAGEGNLPKASVVIVSQVLNFDRRDLDDLVGSVSARTIRQILNGIYGILEPREPVD
jgi:mRNA interferase MazF